MKSNQFLLLKTSRFLPLFITQFLSAFNDNVFKNGLVILITYRLAEISGLNGQILVTLAAGIFILPFFLFSATAGQLADKYEKSRLMAIIRLIGIFLMVLAVFGFYLKSITLLMLVLFALGTDATFFGPLKYAILPEHLHEDELIAGNGMIEGGTFLAILFGTIIGGALILYQFGIHFISFLIVMVAILSWMASLFIPTSHRHNPNLPIRFNIIKETRQLIRYSREHWEIYLSILGISWFWLVGATFLSEFPVFAKDFLHANQSIVTLFLTLFSIGLAIGSLLCNRILKGKVDATYVPLGALGMTVFTIDLYYIATYGTSFQTTHQLITLFQFLSSFEGLRISVDLLLIAICGGIFTVPLYAILQARSEKTHRARVIASNNVINALFMVLAAILIMIMLKIGFTVPEVFLAIGIGNGLVAIYICKLLPEVLVKGFFHWILTALYRVKVVGVENYAKAGDRVVIIANHTSFLDALLLASFLPDKLTFAVNTITARKWWIKLFLRIVDAFPIDPTNPMAIKSLIEFVKQNKRCVIFPEGRLTVTGALMKIYEGPGLVADKSNAKLLPIRIQGAQFTPFSRLRGKVRIRWAPKIKITIFPPETIDLPSELRGRKRRQKIGYKLYDVMTEVMFESSDYRKTLFTALLDAQKTHGSHLEIIEDISRDPIHYKQFITRCFILGRKIAKKTERGENVGILLPNMISCAITFFAMQAYHRVPAMLNYSTGIHNVLMACKISNVKTVYTSRQFIELAKLEEMANTLKNADIHLIYLEDLRASLTFLDKLIGFFYSLRPFQTYQALNPTEHTESYLNANVPAVVLFTSGSEGNPKGVVLSHINICANIFQMSACVDFSLNDRVFNALPVFHSFGLTGGMLLPLLFGVKLFLYPSPLHYRIVPELTYDTNSTILFGTDTFLSGYAKYASPYDFYSVRYVFAGAEKLRDETRLIWSQRFGVRIFEGYGTTETSPVLATNTPMQNKIGTVGRLLPSIHYQIKKIPGIEEGGELLVSGPNVMKGYLLADQPGVLIPPKEGWYETGDVVTVDEVSFIIIKGRVKRFAKIAGEMVSLVMIEQFVNLLWPDFEHAVVNLPDAKKGEQIILITTNPHANREEIVLFFKNKKLSEIMIPKKIIILQKLPLLGTGKVDYTALKEMINSADIN